MRETANGSSGRRVRLSPKSLFGARQDDASKPAEESSPWPSVHPMVALAVMPLLPSWFWMNRGFTQWFHWGFVYYMATGRGDFMRRFQVIIGGAVCVGWYLAVAHDFAVHSRFCHLLYNNMPGLMKNLMLENGHLASGGIITDNGAAVAAVGLSHFFDFLAHPYLTYVAWKMHSSRGGSLRNLVTWDVLVAAYGLRCFYSTSHQYYNFGAVTSPFYYGYEVYYIDTLDSYTVAYAGEAIWFAGLISWKLYLQWMRSHNLRLNIRIGGSRSRSSRRRLRKKLSSTSNTMDVLNRRKPDLIQSTSCFSTDSTVMADADAVDEQQTSQRR